MSRVSVIIPVFNGAATVQRAVESVLDQTYRGEVEIVAVNDGSTDSTSDVLDTYGPRITVISQRNLGLATARNRAVSASTGEYVAFLDADDTWLSNKLSTLVAALQETRDAILAYSDIIPIDANNMELSQQLISEDFAHAPSLSELLEKWWPILPSTAVVKRPIFEACGGFCEEFKRAYEDVDLWLRLRERGDFVYLPERLVKYHTRPTSDRMLRYEDDYAVFARRIFERYGARAKLLLRSTRDAYVSALGHSGLLAMQVGEVATARHYFLRAWRYERLSLKTTLRLARTFLPASLAKALSGKTRNVQPR